MVFSSIAFLFYFLPIVLLLYYTVCRFSIRLRNIFLLAASLFFYGWGEPYYILLLIGSCVLTGRLPWRFPNGEMQTEYGW